MKSIGNDHVACRLVLPQPDHRGQRHDRPAHAGIHHHVLRIAQHDHREHLPQQRPCYGKQEASRRTPEICQCARTDETHGITQRRRRNVGTHRTAPGRGRETLGNQRQSGYVGASGKKAREAVENEGGGEINRAKGKDQAAGTGGPAHAKESAPGTETSGKKARRHQRHDISAVPCRLHRTGLAGAHSPCRPQRRDQGRIDSVDQREAETAGAEKDQPAGIGHVGQALTSQTGQNRERFVRKERHSGSWRSARQE